MTLGRASALGYLLPVALGLGGGCAGTETGNPTLPSVELRVSGFSNDFQSVTLGATGPGLTLDRVLVALERVELEPCTASRAPLRFDGLGADLMERPAPTNTATGTDSEYCAARVALAPAVGGDLPELEGRSVLVQGSRADGTPFEIASALRVEIDLSTMPPNTPFGTHGLLLAFNMATWFEGVGVDSAVAQGGAIAIDETHNPEVLAAFEARASLSPALYDDADGNGLLAGDNQPPTAGP